MLGDAEFDAEMTQAIGGLAEFLPLKVTAELIVDLRDCGRPFSRRKEWPGLFGTDHVDEDEVLAERFQCLGY